MIGGQRGVEYLTDWFHPPLSQKSRDNQLRIFGRLEVALSSERFKPSYMAYSVCGAYQVGGDAIMENRRGRQRF